MQLFYRHHIRNNHAMKDTSVASHCSLARRRWNQKWKQSLGLLSICAALVLSGCGGGGGGAAVATGVTTGGGAVKGPLDCSAQGSVIATGAGGKTATGSTPSVGSFTVDMTGLTFPVTVTVSGCMDTITGATQDFDLSTMVMDATQTAINATPVSTLAVATAKAARVGGGAITQADLNTAVATVLRVFGLSTSFPNPVTGVFKTVADITNLVVACEAVSELIKRSATATPGGASAANIIASFAADLTDGALDGAAPAGVPILVPVATAGGIKGNLIAKVFDEVAAGNVVVHQIDPLTGAVMHVLPSNSLLSAIAAQASATTGTAITAASINPATTATSINARSSARPVIVLKGTNPMTVAQGSTFTDPGSTVTDNVDKGLVAKVTGAVNTGKVGIYKLTYNVKDTAGNAGISVTRTVNVMLIDKVAPLITLKGANPMTVAQGSTFTDPGSTVTDNVDKGLVAKVTGAVNTAKVGIYKLTYNVKDAAGNAATPVTRTVNVADQTAPVITLKGANPMTVAQGSTFTDPGSTVTDNVDKGLVATVTGAVNTAKVGIYKLTYNVKDAAGNAATPVTRTVNVTDQTAPVITLKGANPMTVAQGSTFTDPGSTVTDNVDKGLIAKVTGAVNTAKVGTYKITYNVSDTAGNTAATVTRRVNVTAPQLTSLHALASQETLTAQGETYQLAITGLYSDGSTKNLTASGSGTRYSTGSAAIASVSAEGALVANSNGLTTVTISNGAVSTQVAITVSILTNPVVTLSAVISGKVLNHATGQPVAGAQVTELNLTTVATTDALGNFVYTVPQGGAYTVFISKPGYVTVKKEIVVDSSKIKSSGVVSLTPFDVKTTAINAVTGGTAINASGSVEVVFPAGALPRNVSVSLTQFDKTSFPGIIPKGQVFIASVQAFPEHITFNQNVTMRIANTFGLPAGTNVPYAYSSHDPQDPSPAEPFYDHGNGKISADGKWLEAQLPHFSCPTFLLPPTHSSGQRPPDLGDGSESQNDDGDDCSSGSSIIYCSKGVLKESHDMIAYKSLGTTRPLSLVYRSDTADTGRILDIPIDTRRVDLPAKIQFEVSIEGVHQTRNFNGRHGQFSVGYYFDGKNITGNNLTTGLYKSEFSVSNGYRGNSCDPGLNPNMSFAVLLGATQPCTPIKPTGFTYLVGKPVGYPPKPYVPALFFYSNNTIKPLTINNQIDSVFGAGWNMSGIDRLYPDPVHWGDALLVKGDSSTVNYQLSGRRSFLEVMPLTGAATTLNHPTDIVYDSSGDILLSDRDNNRVLRVKADGTTTIEATLTAPTSLAIASNDDLYISTLSGVLYKLTKASGQLVVYYTLQPPGPGLSTQKIALDSLGNLYVYNQGLHNMFLHKIDINLQETSLLSGRDQLNVTDMAVSPDDQLYLSYNQSGFTHCGTSFIAKYTPQGLRTVIDNLNSPSGLTFDPNGAMYMVENSCNASNDFRVYVVDKTGAIQLFNPAHFGSDPNYLLGEMHHGIAWHNGGVAIAGSIKNQLYRIQQQPFAPQLGDYTKLVENVDKSYTLTTRDGRVSQFNAKGWLTSKADRNGNATTYTYDGNGKLQMITDPVGKVTTLNYNNGKIERIIDPAGRTTSFAHNASGDLISVTDPDGAVTTYGYNNHLLISKTVPSGSIYRNVYDQYHRIIKTQSPTGEVRQYQAGKMVDIINNIPDVAITPNTPNSVFPALTDISTLANTFTDTLGNISSKKIDLNGYMTEATDPLGRSTVYTRDPNRNLILVRKPNGDEKSMTYDAKANLLSVTTTQNGASYHYTYEPVFNQITSITDPLGNTSTMRYDVHGNLTGFTDALGNIRTMAYDTKGLLTSMTDPLGNVSTLAYDAVGNLHTATDSLGNITTFNYDAAGNLITATDAESKTTRMQYDMANNISKVIAADGAVTTWLHSAGERCPLCGAAGGADLLASITDASGHATAFTYNPIGQVTKITDTAGLATSYGYDLNRKLTSKTDANGKVSAYQYDAAGQLIQKTLPADTVHYTYDAVGSLSSVKDADSQVFRGYNLQGRLAIENLTGLPVPVINSNYTIAANNLAFENRTLTVDGAILTVIGTHTFKDLTLKNNAILVSVDGTINANIITLINSSSITHAAATSTTEHRLVINATSMNIDVTSTIDVTAKGYLGGYQGDNASATGRTLGNTTTGGAVGSGSGYNFAGGSYGGRGANGRGATGRGGNATNATYGSYRNPDDLGSGGAGSRIVHPGGNGGGLVRISATTMQLNGTVLANGGPGIGGCCDRGGSGSGGGIRLDVGALSGTGSINANGDNLGAGIGGGGRIAIYGDITAFNRNNIHAMGGGSVPGSAASNGGAGTIFLKTALQTYGDLIVDNGGKLSSTNSTPLPSVGSGVSTGLTATILDDSTANWQPGSLVGLYLNPNTLQGTANKIIANTATSITTDIASGDMTTVAAVGNTYRGQQIFDHLFVQGSANVSTPDTIKVMNPVTNPVSGLYEIIGTLNTPALDLGVTPSLRIRNGSFSGELITQGAISTLTLDNSQLVSNQPINVGSLSLINSSNITHAAATSTTEYRLVINATSITIDATSTIDVSAKGYLGGYQGDNASATGRTVGNTTIGGAAGSGGAFNFAGGSYGGRGATGRGGNATNATYGSYRNPDDLGSGGAGSRIVHPGGNGGGLVRISATTMQLNGTVLANGGPGIGGCCDRGGSGSGGGIRLDVGALSGTGSINANGDNLGAGIGGGGRIAIYGDITVFNRNNIHAMGGGSVPGSAASNGGAGTIFLKTALQTYGDLIVDNGGKLSSTNSTPLPSVGVGVSTGLTATLLGDSTANWQPGSLVGLYLNPNTLQGTANKIIANTATSITTDIASGDMTTVAAVGNTYRGQQIFDHLFVQGSANVSTPDTIKVITPVTNPVTGLYEIIGTLNTPTLDLGVTPSLRIFNGSFSGELITQGAISTLTLDNSSLTVNSPINAGSLSLINSSSMTYTAATSSIAHRLVINATSITIDATSTIDVTAKGYLGGNQGGNTSSTGRTMGNTTTGGARAVLNIFGIYESAGGSYGGRGRFSTNAATYGNYRNPDNPGSGGAGTDSSRNYGGNGGGLVRIHATTMLLNGMIIANGGPGSYSCCSGNSGGGSGGGIRLDVGTLSGIGSINANGDGAYYQGGGGRIAIYGDITVFNRNNIHAMGGGSVPGSATSNGGAGTIFLKTALQTYGDLIVDNGGKLSSTNSTPLPSVGVGVSTGLTATLLGDSTATWQPGSLVGLYLNPNTLQGTVYTIVTNTANSITTALADGDMTIVSAPGGSYIGDHRFDNLTVINGASLFTTDNINQFGILNFVGGSITANNQNLIGLIHKLKSNTGMQAAGRKNMIPENKVTVLPRQGQARSLAVDTKQPVSNDQVSNIKDQAKAALPGTEPVVLASLMPGAEGRMTDVLPQLPDGMKKETAKSKPGNHDANGVDPSYTYDLNGNVSTMVGPNGMTWSYQYDTLNRLIKITNPANGLTTFTYDALGRRASMVQANGVITTYSYDANSRLTAVLTKNAAGATVNTHSYSHNKVGHRLTMTDNNGVHHYTYDAQYRLVAATHPQAIHTYNANESFSYDAVGNRLSSISSSNYTYNNLNRLVQDATYNYAYNNNGNLISKTNKTTLSVTHYQYDDANRLIKVITPTDQVAYQYDGLGRRTARILNGVITKFVYDRSNILFELDGNDVIRARYTYGPGIDKPISVERDTNNNGILDTTFYYHSDGLNSITAMTDASGNTVKTYEYDSFGKIVKQTGNITNSYTYTGREWDDITGLYYYRARYYDAVTGRFIQRDPIGFAGGDLNLYVYVLNNPVRWYDPSGLAMKDPVTNGIGTAATVTGVVGAIVAGAADLGESVLHGSTGLSKASAVTALIGVAGTSVNVLGGATSKEVGAVLDYTGSLAGLFDGAVLASEVLAGTASGSVIGTAATVAGVGFATNTLTTMFLDVISPDFANTAWYLFGSDDECVPGYKAASAKAAARR